jgi:hypothetical protein
LTPFLAVFVYSEQRFSNWQRSAAAAVDLGHFWHLAFGRTASLLKKIYLKMVIFDVFHELFLK